MSTLTKIWEINCQFYPLDSKEKVAESRAPPIQPQKCVKYPKYFPQNTKNQKMGHTCMHNTRWKLRLGVIPLNIQWLSCILIGCILYAVV